MIHHSGRLFLLAAVVLLSQAPRSATAPHEETPRPADVSARTDLYGDPLPIGALQRLGAVQFRFENYGCLNTVLPDGKTLVVSTGRQLRLIDMATGKELRKFDEHTAHISSLAVSPDAQQLVGCDKDGTLRLWDLATGKEVRRFTGEARNLHCVHCVRFSPDGKTLAADWDKMIVLWDVATGKELRQLSTGAQSTVFALDFSPDGKTLAVATDVEAVSRVRLLDTVTGKELRSTGLQGRAWQIAFAPDGQTLMAIEPIDFRKATSTIHLWDVATWKHRPLPDQAEYVHTAVFSPDSKTLASGGGRQTCLWDVATGRLRAPFQGKHLPASTLVYAPDGKTLVTSNGKTMRFWNAATGEERTPIQAGHQDAVEALAHQPDGKTLATVGRDQTLRLWDLATGKEVRSFRELAYGSNPKYCFAPDGKTLGWCADQEAVHLWDVAAGKEMRRVPVAVAKDMHRVPGRATSLAFSADGTTLAIGRPLESLLLWDLAAGKARLGLSEKALALALAPNGKYLAAFAESHDAEDDGDIVRLWDATRGRSIRHWPGNFPSYPFMFSPDSRLLALNGRQPRTLSLWELAAHEERFHLTAPQEDIRALAFSQDGKLLAVGTANRNSEPPTLRSHAPTLPMWMGTNRLDGNNVGVHVFDMANGRELAHFQGQRGAITALSFSRDDRVLASASADSTVLLWDVAALQPRQPRPATPVTANDLNTFWADLAAEGGEPVQRAVLALAAVPTQTHALIKERLKVPQPIEPQRLSQLIADLDSDRFAVRKKATEELERSADLAEPALEKALEDKPALEPRQRIENILAKLKAERVPAPEILRALRAIEVLERIGSDEARQLLEPVAAAAPASRVTQEAKSALQRLAARRGRP